MFINIPIFNLKKPSIMPIRTEHLGKISHMQFELVHLNHEVYLMMGCMNDD